MNNKLKKAIMMLAVLVGLFVINNSFQKGYLSNQTAFFDIDKNNILKIVISSKQDAIELMKADTSWIISGNDTLIVKQDVIENLFDRMQQLKKQHLVTSKKDNWNNYGVADNNGTHLAFINLDGLTVAYYVFGQSKEEYNRCYVRMEKDSDVFLLNDNILYQLQVNPDFWGTKIITE